MGLLAAALILDLLIGDPDFLWRRMPHPVVLFGKLIDFADRRLAGNSQAIDFRNGVIVLIGLFVVCLTVWAVVGLISVLSNSLAWVVEMVIVSFLIAQKGLYQHVMRVADGLESAGLEGGREQVSMIVGRDVSQLDEDGISKAAIESLAENFSDGVVAPVFWYVIAGLPGILFYKAVNTADSMIGHHTPRYEFFGKASARLDDLMNWPAARLSFLLVLAVMFFRRGMAKTSTVWSTTMRDAPKHRSPNAGWPEAAFAAALGLTLGGPRRYGKDEVDGVRLNPDGRDKATVHDVHASLELLQIVCLLLVLLVICLWFVGL